MKKLIVTLMLAGATLSSFAGILENRKTGETLEFNLSRQAREVEVLSTAAGVSNKVLKLHEIRRDKAGVRVYGTTVDVCDGSGSDVSLCIFFPLPVATVAFDTLMLPFKGVSKIIKTSRAKKDFRILMKVINGTEVIEVSDKRFQRIEQLLK